LVDATRLLEHPIGAVLGRLVCLAAGVIAVAATVGTVVVPAVVAVVAVAIVRIVAAAVAPLTGRTRILTARDRLAPAELLHEVVEQVAHRPGESTRLLR